MIGETPQPGEKPSHEGNPWSFSDPGAGWWRPEPHRSAEGDRAATDPPTGRPRHPRRRAPQHQAAPGGTGTLLPPSEVPRRSPEEAEAHAAAVQDTTRQLDPEVRSRAEQIVERDHDLADRHRYDPLRPPAGHVPLHAAKSVAADFSPEKAAKSVAADFSPEKAAKSVAADFSPEKAALPPAEEAEKTEQPPAPEPDVMVLPEPNTRNRPTVPLEPAAGPVPGLTRQNRRVPPERALERPTEPLPRATGDPETDARLERLENSPFWHSDPETVTEPLPAERPAHAGTRRAGRRPSHRTPVAAFLSLIALGLLAAFFAWVSAEPFWLAMGHGDRGYATVSSCTGSGVTQHCTGGFAAADGSFTISRVTLLGVGPGHRVPGTVSPARMVSPDSYRAYLGDTGPLLQARWLLGFTLVLFCGYAIAGVTGARRLETARARRGAVLASLAGPLLLLAGFLIAAY
ncbi:hypothetical protein ACQP2F_42995 [Actinoplanes sp. CA-030573]|uniref:hypothetical protein n=1 Tax=Actinoplanes sp. CA-030573 TaxID=3239898 RepID=UPI003D8BF362